MEKRELDFEGIQGICGCRSLPKYNECYHPFYAEKSTNSICKEENCPIWKKMIPSNIGKGESHE